MKGTLLMVEKSEKVLVLVAIENYLQQLTPGEKPCYVMTKNRLMSGNLYVDGVYMRCMENALHFLAKLGSQFTDVCLQLQEKIKNQRETFQFNAIKNLGI